MGKKRGPPLITPRLGLSQDAVNKLLRPHKRRFGNAKTPQPQQFMSDFSHRFLRRYRGKKPVVWETYVDPNEEGMPVHQNYRYVGVLALLTRLIFFQCCISSPSHVDCSVFW